MKKTNRLIDFFAVIGPDNQFSINDTDIEKEKNITSLEIINAYFNNQMDSSKDNLEEWIDLDGTRTLWLKIGFNQKYIPPITHLEFLYMPFEAENLKIPTSLDCFPIPVKKSREKSEHRFGGTHGKYNFFQGNYDLTKLLDSESKPGYNLVLCYRVQSKRNFNTPISQLMLVIGEKSKRIYKANLNPNDYQIYLPKDFKPLTISFGVPEKNRMLCYKRKTDIFKISYMPKVLDKYPDDEFPEAIAMFCFPEGMYLYQNESPNPKAFSFILTQADGARIYGTSLCFYEPIDKELYKNIGHIDSSITVIGQKAICLISHFPYMNEFKRILRQLYRISLSNTELPIERYISNIVNDIRFSSEANNSGLQYDIGSDSIIFKTSTKFQYISDESLKNFFRVLDVERIIYLFECVLLERKILLISKYKSLLTQVAECLTGLIYPFVWTHVLIPILPENLKCYIDAPVPFIIGISSQNKTGDENNTIKQSDNINVYLDTCDLIFVENLPPLPEKPLAQLKKRLAPYENFHKTKSKEILENIDSAFDIAIIDSDPNEEYFNCSEIRDAFFEFISSFLKDYRKFVSGLSQNKLINTDFSEVFNIKGFLETNKSLKQGSFIYKLTETGLFTYFVETSISVQNEIDFTFLNSALKAKRDKKNTVILKLENLNKIIACPQPTDQGLKQKKEFYRYNTFPKFIPELFAKPLFLTETINEWKSVDNIGDLNSLDESKWAKLLLESIYTIWFIIFNIKIKLEYMDCFAQLTEYSYSLLEDMKKKGIIPNITILRCLIEGIGYYFADKQEKLQDLVKLMNNEKIESMNLHGAYISAVSAGRSLKQKKDKSTIKIVQVEENDDDVEENKESFPESFPFEKKFDQKNNNTENFSQFDNIIITFDDSCPHCNRQLYPEEIFSGWKKSYQEYITSCPGCKKNFASNLKIIEMMDTHQKSTPIMLFSPIVVRKELENINHHIGGKNIFSENFQNNQQHKVIFWNIYFYLSLLKIPTFILDKNQSEKFLEDNIRNLFKEMTNKPASSKTIYQNSKDSINNFNSYRAGSIDPASLDKNILQSHAKDSPILTINSNNSKSLQSTNLSNQSGPSHKISQVSQINPLFTDKNNAANPSIKKVFGNLLKDFKAGLEYKANAIQIKRNLDYRTF